MKKRTTLVLDDAAIAGVRDLARREGRQRFELPSFPMGRPRVNLGDRNALEALIGS